MNSDIFLDIQKYRKYIGKFRLVRFMKFTVCILLNPMIHHTTFVQVIQVIFKKKSKIFTDNEGQKSIANNKSYFPYYSKKYSTTSTNICININVFLCDYRNIQTFISALKVTPVF